MLRCKGADRGSPAVRALYRGRTGTPTRGRCAGCWPTIGRRAIGCSACFHSSASRRGTLTMFVASSGWAGTARFCIRGVALSCCLRRRSMTPSMVPDPILLCHRSAGCRLRTGPGLTGLLHAEADPSPARGWVTGREVMDALRELDQLPDLIRSYLAAVSARADRLAAARKSARGGDAFSDVSADEIEAVAWVAAAMRAGGARTSGRAVPVTTTASSGKAHGRTSRPTETSASTSTSSRRTRAGAFDAAIRHGPPLGGWTAGRRSKADTFRIWEARRERNDAPEAAKVRAVAGVGERGSVRVTASRSSLAMSARCSGSPEPRRRCPSTTIGPCYIIPSAD